MTHLNARTNDVLEMADMAVDSAFNAQYRVDPLLGDFSRVHLIMNSLTRAHGHLLEQAIAAALRQNTDIEVCQNLRFPITDAARSLVASNRRDTLDKVRLTFDSEARTSYDIDLAAVTSDGSRCWAVDVKRGAGITGGSRRAALERELLCVQLLLRSFFRQQGYEVDRAEVAIIDVYGNGGFGSRLVVNRDGIDKFFGVPVLRFIEQLDERLRSKIRSKLPAELHEIVPRLTKVERATTAAGGSVLAGDDSPVAPTRSRWMETFAGQVAGSNLRSRRQVREARNSTSHVQVKSEAWNPEAALGNPLNHNH